MFSFIKNERVSILRKSISLIIVISFMFTSIITPANAQAISGLNLPVPGAMVLQSPAFVPVLLKGMTVHPDNPMKFDFILDSGNTDLEHDEMLKESDRLVKYFLASMTVPKDDLWVNLSPEEPDRIIPSELGKTELGRDLLAQDYILKQLTASLMYPEDELGQKFWDKVYKQAQEKFGTTEIPVNTFNKVWILPESATVYEHENTVYVVESKLKVMTDVDYLSMQENGIEKIDNGKNKKEDRSSIVNSQSSIIKEIIIPAIEKEVNEGENFAPLRQIYHSLILAKWYKETIKTSLLSQIYVDQNKVTGIELSKSENGKANGEGSSIVDSQSSIVETIYDQYMEAYKKGVYGLIKEEYDSTSQQIIPRRYFSGGIKDAHIDLAMTTDRKAIEKSVVGQSYDLAMAIEPQSDNAMSVPAKELFLKSDKTYFMEQLGLAWISLYEKYFGINKQIVERTPEDYFRKVARKEIGSFVIQFNFHRSEKRAPDRAEKDNVVRVEKGGFNFGKVEKERGDVPMLWNQIVDNIPVEVFEQPKPLGQGHHIVLPEFDRVDPQVLTRNAIHVALHLVKSKGYDDHYKMGFNSWGAWGSVNHLHLQPIFYENVDDNASEMVIEEASQTQGKTINGVAFSELVGYPVRTMVFESDNIDKLRDSVERAVVYLQDNNIPHNLIFTKTKENKLRVYLAPRKFQEPSSLGTGVAFFELGGELVSIFKDEEHKRRVIEEQTEEMNAERNSEEKEKKGKNIEELKRIIPFEAVREQDIIDELEKVSLGDKEFNSVVEDIFDILKPEEELEGNSMASEVDRQGEETDNAMLSSPTISLTDERSVKRMGSKAEEIVEGVTIKDVKFEDKNKFSKGRVVYLDPEKFSLEMFVESKAQSYNFIKNGVDQGWVNKEKAKGRIDLGFKEFPGKTVRGFVDYKNDETIIFAVNGHQGNFYIPNTLLIINGEVISKTAPGVGQDEDKNKFEPLSGFYNFFVLDSDKLGIRTIRLENGEPVKGEDISNINFALTGPILRDSSGNNVSENVKQVPNGEVVLQTNEVTFDPERTPLSISLIGLEQGTRQVVVLTMIGQFEGDKRDEIVMKDINPILDSLKLTDVILLGTSADAQQYVFGEKDIKAKPRQGSRIMQDRVLANIIYARKKPLSSTPSDSAMAIEPQGENVDHAMVGGPWTSSGPIRRIARFAVSLIVSGILMGTPTVLPIFLGGEVLAQSYADQSLAFYKSDDTGPAGKYRNPEYKQSEDDFPEFITIPGTGPISDLFAGEFFSLSYLTDGKLTVGLEGLKFDDDGEGGIKEVSLRIGNESSSVKRVDYIQFTFFTKAKGHWMASETVLWRDTYYVHAKSGETNIDIAPSKKFVFAFPLDGDSKYFDQIGIRIVYADGKQTGFALYNSQMGADDNAMAIEPQGDSADEAMSSIKAMLPKMISLMQLRNHKFDSEKREFLKNLALGSASIAVVGLCPGCSFGPTEPEYYGEVIDWERIYADMQSSSWDVVKKAYKEIACRSLYYMLSDSFSTQVIWPRINSLTNPDSSTMQSEMFLELLELVADDPEIDSTIENFAGWKVRNMLFKRLLENLKNESADENTRYWSTVLIGKIGSMEDLEYKNGYMSALEAVLEKSLSERLRTVVENALLNISINVDVDVVETSGLIEMLESPTWEAQREAAKELYRRGDAYGIRQAQELLVWPRINRLLIPDSMHFLFYCDTHKELVELGRIAEQPLIENIQDTNANTDTRKWSAYILGEVGDYETAYPVLMAVINNEGGIYQSWHQTEAANGFVHLIKRAPFDIAVEYLSHNNSAYRNSAAIAIINSSDERVPEQLVSIMQNGPGNQNRILAVKALGDLYHVSAIETMMQILNSANQDLSLELVNSLGKLRASEAASQIYRFLRIHEGVYSGGNSTVLNALLKIGTEEAARLLSTGLSRSSDEYLKKALIAVLGDMGFSVAIETISTFLSSSRVTQRRAAAYSLAQIGDDSAIPVLEHVRNNDVDNYVRIIAHLAIVVITTGNKSLLGFNGFKTSKNLNEIMADFEKTLQAIEQGESMVGDGKGIDEAMLSSIPASMLASSVQESVDTAMISESGHKAYRSGKWVDAKENDSDSERFAKFEYHPKKDGVEMRLFVDKDLAGKISEIDRRTGDMKVKEGGSINGKSHDEIRQQSMKNLEEIKGLIDEELSSEDGEKVLGGLSSAENLFLNRPVVSFINGEVVYSMDTKGEFFDVEKGVHPMLVMWKDGRVTIRRDVSFVVEGERRGVNKAQMSIVKYDGKKKDVTGEVRAATFLQLIGWDNDEVDPAESDESLDWYDDPRHLISSALFEKDSDYLDIKIQAGQGLFFGIDQLLADKTKFKDAMKGAVELDLTLPLKEFDKESEEYETTVAKFSEELKRRLEALGYNEKGEGEVLDVQGDFRINVDTGKIRIYFKDNNFPLHIVGIKEDDTVIDMFIDAKRQVSGVTVRNAFELMKQEGAMHAGIIDQGNTMQLVVDGETLFVQERKFEGDAANLRGDMTMTQMLYYVMTKTDDAMAIEPQSEYEPAEGGLVKAETVIRLLKKREGVALEELSKFGFQDENDLVMWMEETARDIVREESEAFVISETKKAGQSEVYFSEEKGFVGKRFHFETGSERVEDAKKAIPLIYQRLGGLVTDFIYFEDGHPSIEGQSIDIVAREVESLTWERIAELGEDYVDQLLGLTTEILQRRILIPEVNGANVGMNDEGKLQLLDIGQSRDMNNPENLDEDLWAWTLANFYITQMLLGTHVPSLREYFIDKVCEVTPEFSVIRELLNEKPTSDGSKSIFWAKRDLYNQPEYDLHRKVLADWARKQSDGIILNNNLKVLPLVSPEVERRLTIELTKKLEQNNANFARLSVSPVKRLAQQPELMSFIEEYLSKRYIRWGLPENLAERILDTLTANYEDFEEARRRVYRDIIDFDTDDAWKVAYEVYKKDTKYDSAYDQIRAHVENLPQGALIVDLGAGNNVFGAVIAENLSAVEVVGVDIMDYHEDRGIPNLKYFKQTSPIEIPSQIKDASVDVLTMNAVLHHVSSELVPELMKEIMRVLKPGGRVILIEDTYSPKLPFLDNSDDDLNQRFLDLVGKHGDQFAKDFFAFNDWYANILVHKWDGMATPYEFKSIEEWQELFNQSGFSSSSSSNLGFPKEGFHKPGLGIMVFNKHEELWDKDVNSIAMLKDAGTKEDLAMAVEPQGNGVDDAMASDNDLTASSNQGEVFELETSVLDVAIERLVSQQVNVGFAKAFSNSTVKYPQGDNLGIFSLQVNLGRALRGSDLEKTQEAGISRSGVEKCWLCKGNMPKIELGLDVGDGYSMYVNPSPYGSSHVIIAKDETEIGAHPSQIMDRKSHIEKVVSILEQIAIKSEKPSFSVMFNSLGASPSQPHFHLHAFESEKLPVVNQPVAIVERNGIEVGIVKDFPATAIVVQGSNVSEVIEQAYSIIKKLNSSLKEAVEMARDSNDTIKIADYIREENLKRDNKSRMIPYNLLFKMRNEGGIPQLKVFIFPRTIEFPNQADENNENLMHSRFGVVEMSGTLITASAEVGDAFSAEKMSESLKAVSFQDTDHILREIIGLEESDIEQIDLAMASSPIDVFRSSYDEQNEKVENLTEITSAMLDDPNQLTSPRRFIDRLGRLKKRSLRLSAGTFGIVEVAFLQDSSAVERMMLLIEDLKQKFGDKLYTLDRDSLHITIQGLEKKWKNGADGELEVLTNHSGKQSINVDGEPFVEVLEKAGEIHTSSFNVQVAGLGWDPVGGIYWELRPYLPNNLTADEITRRRHSWNLPSFRPPHITAAYFAQPLSTAELNELKRMMRKYNVGYFGDVQVDKLDVIAYEDFSFNSGYRALQTTPLEKSEKSLNLTLRQIRRLVSALAVRGELPSLNGTNLVDIGSADDLLEFLRSNSVLDHEEDILALIDAKKRAFIDGETFFDKDEDKLRLYEIIFGNRKEDVGRVTVFSGGSGSNNLSRGLLAREQDLTLLLNAYDDGKSTGDIRRNFNVLGPSDMAKNVLVFIEGKDENLDAFLGSRFAKDADPSDLREQVRSIAIGEMKGELAAALSKVKAEFQDIIREYVRRFWEKLEDWEVKNDEEYNMADYGLRNIVFTGAFFMHGEDYHQTIRAMLKDFGAAGRVILNNQEPVWLIAVTEKGELLNSEAAVVDDFLEQEIVEDFLVASVLTEEEVEGFYALDGVEARIKYISDNFALDIDATNEAVQSIENAETIVFAPTTFHSSLAPTLTTRGISSALGKSRVPKILIANLVRERGRQTIGEIVEEMTRYINLELDDGEQVGFDYLVVNAHGYRTDGVFNANRIPIDGDVIFEDGVELIRIKADQDNKGKHEPEIIADTILTLKAIDKIGYGISQGRLKRKSEINSLELKRARLRSLLSNPMFFHRNKERIEKLLLDILGISDLEEYTPKGSLKVVILGAGKATRLNSNIPKALYPINGKANVSFILDAVESIDSEPILVINSQNTADIAEWQKGDHQYIPQIEIVPAGGGTAIVLNAIKDKLSESGAEDVLLLWGDISNVQTKTLIFTLAVHKALGTPAMTIPTSWESDPYAGLLRDPDGNVVDVFLTKEHPEQRQEFGEHDGSIFLFDVDETMYHLEQLINESGYNEGAISEVNFLKVIPLLIQAGEEIIGIGGLDPREATGFNTIEEARIVENNRGELKNGIPLEEINIEGILSQVTAEESVSEVDQERVAFHQALFEAYMQSFYKSVVIDIDDTITDHVKVIPSDLVDRLVELANNDIEIGIVTGRTNKSLKQKLLNSILKHPDLNGAKLGNFYVYPENGAYGYRLNQDEARARFYDHRIYSNYVAYISSLLRDYVFGFEDDYSITKHKIHIWPNDPTKRDEYYAKIMKLIEITGLPLVVYKSNAVNTSGSLLIMMKGLSKATALQDFLQRTEQTVDDVAKIGDLAGKGSVDHSLLKGDGSFSVGEFDPESSNQVAVKLVNGKTNHEAARWLLNNLAFISGDLELDNAMVSSTMMFLKNFMLSDHHPLIERLIPKYTEETPENIKWREDLSALEESQASRESLWILQHLIEAVYELDHGSSIEMVREKHLPYISNEFLLMEAYFETKDSYNKLRSDEKEVVLKALEHASEKGFNLLFSVLLLDEHIKRLQEREGAVLDLIQDKWKERLELALDWWFEDLPNADYVLDNIYGENEDEIEIIIQGLKEEIIRMMLAYAKETGSRLFIYSGGSGVGKTTLWDAMLEDAKGEMFQRLLMYTTRERRADSLFKYDVKADSDAELYSVLGLILNNKVDGFSIESVSVETIDAYKEKLIEQFGSEISAPTMESLNVILNLKSVGNAGKRQTIAPDKKGVQSEYVFLHERLGWFKEKDVVNIRVFGEFDGVDYYFREGEEGESYLDTLEEQGVVQIFWMKSLKQAIAFEDLESAINEKEKITLLDSTPQIAQELRKSLKEKYGKDVKWFFMSPMVPEERVPSEELADRFLKIITYDKKDGLGKRSVTDEEIIDLRQILNKLIDVRDKHSLLSLLKIHAALEKNHAFKYVLDLNASVKSELLESIRSSLNPRGVMGIDGSFRFFSRPLGIDNIIFQEIYKIFETINVKNNRGVATTPDELSRVTGGSEESMKEFLDMLYYSGILEKEIRRDPSVKDKMTSFYSPGSGSKLLLDVDEREDLSIYFYSVTRQRKDNAMSADVGGIDLNNIEVDRKGMGTEIQFDPVVLEDMSNITGFVPVIINLTPINSILPLLGFNDESGSGSDTKEVNLRGLDVYEDRKQVALLN